MQDLEAVFAALRQSSFRSRFHLQGKEWEYLQAKGLPVVLEHAADFIQQRLAPAMPAKDGKQTPWRGHPVFLAQHATATCCRGCLEKWHGIARGQELSEAEQQYVVSVIEKWLTEQAKAAAESHN
ncbi:MAG: DUF4186 domain-containing protein [Abitibacteriaceae bacterium]|nr:DUF4186 domain-containing protein [Abditibacteriaceae bacterium]